jgi:antitoxin component YwqK of YwqJK toxin-antitoxin module
MNGIKLISRLRTRVKKKRQIDDGENEVWPDDNYTGLWEIYWPNLVIKFRANYVNGQEEGECLCFWDNGNLAQRGVKVEGHCDGIWTDYSYEGRKSLEGRYVNRQKEGAWTSFWDDGSVMKEEEYLNGLRHGYSRHFSDDGELIHEGEFRNGEPYNGICHVRDHDRHPHYTMIAEYLEGEIVRELPFESCLRPAGPDEAVH